MDENAVDASGPTPLRLNVQPPAWDDFSSGEDSDQEDDERPLTREELKRKTLRGGAAGNGIAGATHATTASVGAGGGFAGGSKAKDTKVRNRRHLTLPASCKTAVDIFTRNRYDRSYDAASVASFETILRRNAKSCPSAVVSAL